MNVFKTKGIVLQVKKQGEKEKLYKVFFYDYGVLLVKKKKKAREKPIDIGYLIGGEIITKTDRDIHTLGSIKILAEYQSEGKSFREIQHFLGLIGTLQKELQIGNPHVKVFDLCEAFLKSDIQSIQHIILLHLKLQALFGNLGDTHSDPTIQKTLKFLHGSRHQDIFRVGKIPEETLRKLEKIAMMPVA